MPTTIEQHKASLHQPAFSELLPVRDILHDVIIRTTGALVAGYELSGINSYYHSDDGRNRTKLALEALIRSLPERSLRMQVRFEIAEGLGDLRERYQQQLRNQNPTLLALDRVRMESWRRKEQEGYYLLPLLHAYFHWNPTVHHELPGAAFGKAVTKRFSLDTLSLSANRCIQRTAREHEDALAEFGSILSGVEQTLRATGMGVRRLTDAEIFLELKRALNPLLLDRVPLRRPESSLQHRSAREQIVNTNIEHEEETYIRIGGLLYSFITLKDLPDATFPGILRDLVRLDFPITVNTDVMIPDQAAMIKHYKGRLKKMQAAQRDSHGGYRIDIDAQVAQRQLIETLENLIASSLKTCRTSMVIGVRTSQPVQSHRDLAEQERVLSDRRQKVLYTVMQMNGSRGLPEDLAKRRLFIGGLPGMTEENQRENDCLTVHAADLLPMETAWRGTPQSPLILLVSPQRQLVPFSPWDSSLADANLLIMAASGGGKTFMAMLFLLMMARLKPLISILERGDSYRPLVELMGGRSIEVDLEGSVTLNPWDLAPGATTPGKDKVAFLKNLTRHMIGDSPNSDTALLDNLLSEAISRTYKRCAIRHSNPTPTFNDLREELQQWRDEERIERTVEEAKLAALKLREWTGEKGVYSKLFDQHTTLKTDADWLFFNVERLSDDPKLETAMSMMIAHAMQERASGKTGQHSITVLDECWSLLDSNVLAPEVVQLFRTARKRGGSVWGISQTLEDFVGTDTQPRIHGPGIVRNVSTKIIGRQPGDVSPLATHLALNQVALVFRNVNGAFNQVAATISPNDWADNWMLQVNQYFNGLGNANWFNLVVSSIVALVSVLVQLVAAIVFPIALLIFTILYCLYGAVLYAVGPMVLALYPAFGVGQLARSYLVNLFVFHAWGIVYALFSVLLTAINAQSLGAMLAANSLGGWFQGASGALLMSLASILFAVMVALIPFLARRIVTGEIGSSMMTVVHTVGTALGAFKFKPGRGDGN